MDMLYYQPPPPLLFPPPSLSSPSSLPHFPLLPSPLLLVQFGKGSRDGHTPQVLWVQVELQQVHSSQWYEVHLCLWE